MACKEVGNKICKNPKFKTTITPGNPTGFRYFLNFAPPKNDINSIGMTWYYCIRTDGTVVYRVRNIKKQVEGVTTFDRDYNSLQEYADGPPFDTSKGMIERVVNSIKKEMNRILKENLQRKEENKPKPKPSPASTSEGATQATQRGSSGSSSASPQAQSSQATSASGTTTTTPSSSKEDLLAPLQESGYLNTSKPKDFPLINQPNGQYKPLSEVSRFVFDQKSPSFQIDLEREYKLNTSSEGDQTGARYSNTNRKRFGANLAVLNKLESVEFHEGKISDEKRDYIAYLIPYGTPSIDINDSSTITTQIPASDALAIGPNKIQGLEAPKGKSKIVAEKNPEAFDLYKSSKILGSLRDGTKLKRDELEKIFIKQWNDSIESKNYDEILDSINQTYSEENYKKTKSDLVKYKLRLQPLLYKKIISNLERDLLSLDKSISGTQIALNSEKTFNYSELTTADIKSTSFKIEREPSVQAFGNFLQNSNGLSFDNPNITISYSEDIANILSSVTISGKSADPDQKSEGKDAGISGIDPSLKVWQFLYNPQSITIDVKADYSESNTWGATDDGQSGQSVIWQRNRNPVMRLDEIVLNGYIHGKKVGQLEEGLFALLMSRDGPGQIQPTVWEFVWGRRRFGPCIINNIQVVEKQWEAGEVLTATVSFELTQIPKWQIIDNTIKFYDPTAMSTFASAPSGITGASGAGGETTPGGTAPGGGQRTASTVGTGGVSDSCQKAFIKNLNNLAKSDPAINYLIKCSDVYYKDPTYKRLYSIQSGGVINFINGFVEQSKCSKLKNSNLKESWVIANYQQKEKFKNKITITLQDLLYRASYCKRSSDFKQNLNADGFNNILRTIKNNISDALNIGFSTTKVVNTYDNIIYSATQKIFGSKSNTIYEMSDIYGDYLGGGGTTKIPITSQKCNSSKLKEIGRQAGNKNFLNSADIGTIITECDLFLYIAILRYMSKKSIPIANDLKKLAYNGKYTLEVYTVNSIPKIVLISISSSSKTNIKINL